MHNEQCSSFHLTKLPQLFAQTNQSQANPASFLLACLLMIISVDAA
jgi:hypothetical protein